jgi:hypothetical protein
MSPGIVFKLSSAGERKVSKMFRLNPDRIRLLSTLALALALGLGLSATALASHEHPNGAAKVRVTLVRDYYDPPSQNLRWPNDDTTKASGSVTVKLLCPTGGTPPCTGEDLRIIASISDVRCAPTHAATYNFGGCPYANTTGGGGEDFNGVLFMPLNFREDQHVGSTSVQWGVGVTCVPTPGDATIGSACNVTTQASAVEGLATPVSGQRDAWEINTPIRVYDPGNDAGLVNDPNVGNCPPSCDPTGDEQAFLIEGLFAP